MQKRRRFRFGYARFLRPGYAGLIACVLVFAVGVKAFDAMGGADAAANVFGGLIGDGTALLLLDMELTGGTPRGDVAAMILGAYYSGAQEPGEAPAEPPEPPPRITAAPSQSPSPPPEPPPPDDPALFYTGSLDAVPGGVDNTVPLPTDGIIISNRSGLDIDAASLLAEPLELNAVTGEINVLIIHTHSSEAYTPAFPGQYEESDHFRTQDKRHNIIKAGEALAAKLAEYGLGVIHDRGVYDYPSYSGAYGRTQAAVRRYLDEYPGITLVIDLHRDAMDSADGRQMRTIADINGTVCSQIMLVVGTDASGLDHPEWRENMKFALRLQSEMNRVYPTLARPILVSQYRYNQHLTPGYLIVEAGATGNTLDESIVALEFFARAYANVALADGN